MGKPGVWDSLGVREIILRPPGARIILWTPWLCVADPLGVRGPWGSLGGPWGEEFTDYYYYYYYYLTYLFLFVWGGSSESYKSSYCMVCVTLYLAICSPHS